MSSSLDEGYFDYLYARLGESVEESNPRRSYMKLAQQLHTQPFAWFVPNDDNREADGRELRFDYIREVGEPVDPLWVGTEASMLEVLLALAKRTAFESYSTEAAWFWQFMRNLGLDKYRDSVYNEGVRRDISKTLRAVIQRTYGWDGSGGIFPLRMAEEDQRLVELWYQMSYYLMESETVANGP